MVTGARTFSHDSSGDKKNRAARNGRQENRDSLTLSLTNALMPRLALVFMWKLVYSPKTPYLKLFGVVLPALFAIAHAYPLDTSDTGISMLEKAQELTDLTAPNTPPYSLHAHFKFFSDDKQAVSGELIIYFSSPSLWREEIKWPGITTIEVATGNLLWRKGIDARRIDALRLARVRQFSKLLSPYRGTTVSAAKTSHLDGKIVGCVKSISGSSIVLEVCLDPVNGLPTNFSGFLGEDCGQVGNRLSSS